jgi:hypothetical protein
MADIKVKINQDKTLKVKTMALGITSMSLLDLTDIDATQLEDGAMMVYDEQIAKFVLKAEVDHPRSKTKIIGGKY